MFKVDFQKAFDSVRWDHLDDILGKYGFGIKWRGWIRGCLQSSKASVLVNGSPTDEFSFHRGLRQGDPFSPFLFILVMKSLHISFQRLIDRVNVHKSSIYGVGVRQADVQHMAENFGCISNNLPFTYLGVKVSANMMRLNSWSDVVKKVSNKLSNWKAKTLFVGGRLTLLKSILGEIPTYYMSLFKAPEELQKDDNVASKLQASNVSSSFRRPPRSGIENSQFIELGQILSSISLSPVSDRWSWTLHGLGDFSVKSAREEIDKHVLVVSPSQNRWSKVLPIKLNVFSWRMMLDRLPTRSNLHNRGVNITCILCLNCGAPIENCNHLFFGCSMSVDLARLIGRWWNINIPIFDDPSSWDSWLNGMNLSSMQRRILEATFISMWWHIWKFRNLTLFSLKKPRKDRIFDDIVSHTYFWLSNRCRSFNISMNVWLNDPLNAL
nr:RNA-directed DNA polymerase, eukaryota [Tanacetum cinerariifolium]